MSGLVPHVDPRLRAAVEASLHWYDEIFAAHGVKTDVEDGVWFARGRPPRWHSAAKTVEPTATEERALRAVEGLERCSVADSFGALDLSHAGFGVLFEASWVHRPPHAGGALAMPSRWSVVQDARTLEAWNVAHDTVDVLLQSLLDHPRFIFLVERRNGRLLGGAVLHDPGGEAVELSNFWVAQDNELDPEALLRCTSTLHPGRAVVGYAWGEELVRLLGAGFSEVGPQVVWAR
jgi:hypothetical protein